MREYQSNSFVPQKCFTTRREGLIEYFFKNVAGKTPRKGDEGCTGDDLVMYFGFNQLIFA